MSGVVANGVYYNTQSGLAAPGGLLDRLQEAMDNRAQYASTLRGIAPTAQGMGIPVPAQPRGIISSLLGAYGLGDVANAVGGAAGSLGGAMGLGGGGSPSGSSGDQAQMQQPPAMPIATAGVGGSGAPAPTMGGGALTSPPTGAAPAPAGGGGSPAPMGMSAYAPMIGQSAQKYGIDPMTAIRVAMAEGGASGGFGASGTGDGGSSFSPFQLHYGGVAGGGNSAAGLGDDFTAATGLDARDPKNAAAAIDFALADAAKNGWSKFHGAAAAGIGQWQGIGGAPSASDGASTQAMAYAPNGGSSAPQQGGGPMMPQATASRPQPPQADVLANSNFSGAQGNGGQGGAGTAAPVGSVFGPIMSNAATRPIGAALLRSAQQGGGVPPTLSLPAGVSAAALGAMIAEPATQQMGIALLQRSMYPPVTSYKPGDMIMRGTQVVGQVPTPLQHVVIGKNAYGEEIYGTFDQNSGRMVPDAPVGQSMPAQAGGQGAGGPAVPVPSQGSLGQGTGGAAPVLANSPDASQPSGPDFLKSLPPPLAAQVQAIAEGRMKLPSGNSANSPLAQRLRSYTLQYDPTFDAANTEARFETRKDFASGTTAQTINAGNTAIQHAADLSDAAEALGNSKYPLVNKVGQAIGNQTGGNIPGKEFQGALNDFAGEVVKFYRSTGGTEADIDAVKAALDPSQSPDQLRAGIAQQARLISGKTNSLNNQWHQGMGPMARDYPLLAPETQAALDRINSRRPSVSSYPPSGGSGPGSGGGSQPNALPVASPAGSIPTLTDPSQLQALPAGSRFRTPDGQLRVKH